MKYVVKYWVVFIVVFLIAGLIKAGFAAILMSAFLIVWSFTAIRFGRKIERTGIHATGTIVSYEPDNDGDPIPVVEFTLLDGEIVKGQPAVFSSTDLIGKKNYSTQVGTEVQVRYLPGEAQKFILGGEDGFSHVVFVFFLFIGLVLLFGGVYSLF